MPDNETTSEAVGSAAGKLMAATRKRGKLTKAIAGVRASLAELDASENHFKHLKQIEAMVPLIQSVAGSASTQVRDKKRRKANG